jgi:hypothetical protein
MAAVIQLREGTKATATFDGVAWESDDEDLAGRLNEYLDEYQELRPDAGEYIPDHVQHVAQLAAQAFGADIIEDNPHEPGVEGVVY